MSSALVKTDFNADIGGCTGVNNSLTRTGIQNGLAPLIAAKLAQLVGYDPMNNVAHARRTLRGLMTIALQPLLSMGAPKEFMRQQLLDALDNALRDHAEQSKVKKLPYGSGAKLVPWKK
jgi:hypothetical protein